MAKAPSVDSFKITCEVEVHNLGPAMVRLAQIEGLIITGSELVTTVRSFAKNATPPGFNTQAFVREWVKEHPTFKAIEVVKAVREAGNGSGSAAYPVLRTLLEDGTLKKLGEGMYSRPDVKALAKPKKAAKAAKSKKQPDIGGGEFALRLMSRNHGRMSSATMKGHFEKDGRSPTGVGPVLSKLMEDKKIKRVGEGLYELTSKKTDKPVTNGAAGVEITSPGA